MEEWERRDGGISRHLSLLPFLLSSASAPLFDKLFSLAFKRAVAGIKAGTGVNKTNLEIAPGSGKHRQYHEDPSWPYQSVTVVY